MGRSLASKKDKLLESSQRFLLKGQLDKAIKDYQQVVALDPKEVRYRQKLAELLVRDNRKEEAIVQYEDIGKHYADNSYFLKAIAVYKQIQRLSPDNTAVSLTLASLNHKQGLIGNALAEYGQVVARFEKEGALKEAVKIVEQMLTVDEAHAATRLKYAELLFASGSKDASCQAFSALLASLRAGGDVAAVQSLRARIDQLFPGQQENDLERISARILAGDLDGAIASLQEKLNGDRANLQAWQLLCDVERRKGNQAGLRQAYRQMVELFPEDPAVLEGAIRCEMKAGDFSHALALLELHLPRFIEKGASPSAEELFLSIPADVAADPRVNAGLRRIYEASGAWDKLNALKRTEAQASQQVAQGMAAAKPSVAAVVAPSAFGPAPAAQEPPAPSAFGAPWAPEAPGATHAAAKSETAELASPWEEEIELDLDDDLHDTVHAAAPDVDISLDFSLSLDFDEPDHLAEPHPDRERETGFSDLPEAPSFAEPPALVESSPFADASPEDDLTCFSDPFASAEELPQGGLALDLDQEELSLELTLPDDAEPPADWAEVVEEVEEVEEVELHELEEVQEVQEVQEPALQQSPGWEEIYPHLESSVASELDPDELESHYDLGIGYKEMGLYNAAIKEFTVAAANPQRRLDCLTLQAICYREKGEPAKAEELLKRGRDLKVLSVDERMSLSYELAFLFESTGAVDEAVRLYREVLEVNPGFHDVAERLATLAGDEPLDVIELELEEGEI